MALLLSSSLHPPTSPLKPKLNSLSTPLQNAVVTKRQLIINTTTSFSIIFGVQQNPVPQCLAQPSNPSKPSVLNIANTKAWFQFYGDGFAIRVPPEFEDIMEPEVHTYLTYSSLWPMCSAANFNFLYIDCLMHIFVPKYIYNQFPILTSNRRIPNMNQGNDSVL